jgi:hypothetical protein
VLEVGKHGTFDVYVPVQAKLGGKVAVAKYAVLSIDHATATPEKATAPPEQPKQ